jgi:hypothetical protein
MDALHQEAMAMLLLSVLACVIAVGFGLMFMVTYWKRRKGTEEVPARGGETPDGPDGMRNPGFRRTACWLAINSRNPVAVQRALSLHNPKPCAWADGISGDAGRKLFISPPVSGWVIVVGPALPDPTDDVDAAFRFLLDLSRKVGHVQCFSGNTVLNHHAWARVEGGRVVRGYTWTGRTQWNQGEPTAAEGDLGLKCHDYGDAPEAGPFARGDCGASNSDKLHSLAARWSIDPDELDERFSGNAVGIVGELSRQL